MIRKLVRCTSAAVFVAAFLVVAPLPARAAVGPETAPANDAFSAAQVISGSTGSVAGTNVDATKEAGEPDHAGDTGGASVWFTWTAPATATIGFDTCTSTDFDTLLAVYSGSEANGLVPIASSDEACGSQSRLRFDAVAGTTYRVAIDGYNLYGQVAAGSFTLTWGPPPPPPANDAFAAATTITGSSGSISGTNVGATEEAGEPDHADIPGDASVWYRWTAPSSGRVLLDTCSGTDFDTLLAVYTGTTVGGLAPVASADDGCGSTSRLLFTVTADTTYQIAIDGANRGWGTATGQFTLSWAPVTPPANDAFAAAQVISGANGSATGSNLGASKEPGEPDHAGHAGGASVWYRWTATTNRTIRFDTCTGTEFDTLLAVYTGTSVNGLTEVASNDDGCGTLSGVELAVTAGTAYRIAVDGFYGDAGGAAQGSYTLTWGPPRVHRPDVLIRKGSGAFVGNNLYNTTGVGQTKSASVAAGGTATFTVKFQNDSDTPDTFRLRGTASNSRFRVTYRMEDGTDVTDLLTAGVTTGTFAPGDSLRLTVTVKAKAGAPRGATISVKVKMTASATTTTDAVLARVTRG